MALDMLSESIQPPWFFVRRADRNKHLSGTKKGGGVCFMINDSWCNCNNIQELKSFCKPVLEFLPIKCRPYCLPREISLVIVTAVYIPLEPIPWRPSRILSGLYANWKPYILRLHFLLLGILTKQILEQDYLNSISILTVALALVKHWIIATLTSAMHTSSSPTHHSANKTTTQFCSYHPIGKN